MIKRIRLIKLHFKKVGQGDSIIIEWECLDIKHVGIIDCNLFNDRNPTLEYLKENSIKKIEFIVISHFHSDHFSGFPDIFQYCIDNKIYVKCCYHTIETFIIDFYEKVFTSKKIESEIRRFFETYELFDDYVKDKVQINSHLREVVLTNDITMAFLAPEGVLYQKFGKQLSRKRNLLRVSYPDINKFSPIILIGNSTDAFLLCADAVSRSFKVLRGLSLPRIILAQVPHHGSWLSINEEFWENLKRIDNCPAVFSIGDAPKDKLPNIETVDFFDKHDYKIYATESVYGISDFFSVGSVLSLAGKKKQRALNTYSKVTSRTQITNKIDDLEGDKVFELFTPLS